MKGIRILRASYTEPTRIAEVAALFFWNFYLDYGDIVIRTMQIRVARSVLNSLLILECNLHYFDDEFIWRKNQRNFISLVLFHQVIFTGRLANSRTVLKITTKARPH